MTSRTPWQPCVEPWRVTMRRTGAIALAVGIAVGLYRRQLAVVPLTTLLALWFSLGGHVVEVLFRNRLRYRIGGQAPVQILTRLVFWFVGGSVLYIGALATRAILTGRGDIPWPWWTGGVFFVGLELVVHLLLRARRQPSFFDGRG